MEKNLNDLKLLDGTKYIHAANYIQKYKNYNELSAIQKKALDLLLPQYRKFLEGNKKLSGHTKDIIQKRTMLLNTYFDYITNNGFDNTFTAQSKFRPTIMEEFMYIVFADLIDQIKSKISDSNDNLKLGGTKAYTNLYFAAKNLEEFVREPKIGVNQKDQDFAIFRPITLNIENTGNIQTNLPIVAIENKTYIDKTMLEGSIATAEKIKSGNPYSLFIIVTETYEVDLSVDPAYSRIDQIYVLRKSKRRDGRQQIYHEVVFDLVDNIYNHLIRNWSDIEQKMRDTGRII